MVLYLSTTYLPLGLMVSSWLAGSVVRRVRFDPSRPALYRCVLYTSWSASRPRALNHTVRVVSSTCITAPTCHGPLVIWFFTLPSWLSSHRWP